MTLLELITKIQRMGGSKDDAITAIIEYLDETAKEKECEHKNPRQMNNNNWWCFDCNQELVGGSSGEIV